MKWDEKEKVKKEEDKDSLSEFDRNTYLNLGLNSNSYEMNLEDSNKAIKEFESIYNEQL